MYDDLKELFFGFGGATVLFVAALLMVTLIVPWLCEGMIFYFDFVRSVCR